MGFQPNDGNTRAEEGDVPTTTVEPGEKPVENLRVGPYQVTRRIGEGGMGSVYLGVRVDHEFNQYVAIKVIRKGMDSEEIIGRFRRERQILAALDHPNIAKLFDGGTTEDGLPYFVMEYISGRALNEYCDSHKLSIKERLRLFQSICSAVQYAHQNLVIHRDLKPANIIVTADGYAKLLDFGIAKVLNPDVFSLEAPPTATGMLVMTPDYASPEQVRSEPLTTASDVYSLGVILYELLTGHRPYRITNRSHMEIFRVVCEQEPRKPSTAVTEGNEDTEKKCELRGALTPHKLNKQLRGDLDNIILMALRKEPQRRYASVQAFSDDIGRYLEGDTVSAHKPTWTYRTGKYIKRHKAAVAAAALLFLLLAAFAVTTSFQNAKIRKERDTSEQVTKLLVGLFEVNDPGETKGETITARELLDRGAERIHEELKDQPDVKAQLLCTMGDIYDKLGLYDQAQRLLEESLQIRKSLYGTEHLAVAESLDKIGLVLKNKGEYDDAERYLREALEMRKKLLGKEHTDVAKSLGDLALVLSLKGQLDEAERLFREALVIGRNAFGEDHLEVARTLNGLAIVVADKGQLDEAEKLYREALAIRRKLLGDEHPDVGETLNDLAVLLRGKGQLDEAEGLLREAVAIDRKVLGNDHPSLAIDLSTLATVLREHGRSDEAETLYREALTIELKSLGNEHPDVAIELANLANVMSDKGQFTDAEKLLREALAIQRKVLGNQHPEVARSLASLAEILLDEGRAQEAIAPANEALSFSRDRLPEDHVYRATSKSALAGCLIAQNRYPEAELLLLESYTVLWQQVKTSTITKRTYQRILDFYKAWGKPEKAEAFRKSHPTPQLAHDQAQ